MRILLIDKEEALKIGGMGIYASRLRSYLIQHGHEVFILRFSKKKIREKHVYSLPYYLAESRTFIVLPSEKTLSLIRYYIGKIRPDIVYTNIGLSPLDFFLPKVCHSLSIPVSGVWHADFNYSEGAHQLLAKSLFLAYLPFCKQLDLLHVFTHKLGSFYLNYGISQDKITILPNGVDTFLYSPGPSRFGSRLNIGTGILFVGRLTLQKNPTALLNAFLETGNFHGTKLVLVGHGDQEESLRQFYRNKNIIFTGLVKDEQRKIDIMRACKIFVLPSRFEGMPLALLEAMSVGLACVASDAGSNSEVLQPAGIVISVSQIPYQLPFILQLLLTHPELITVLGTKARQHVCTGYAQEKIFQKLVNSFEETIVRYNTQKRHVEDQLLFNLQIGKQVQSIWRKMKIFSETLWE